MKKPAKTFTCAAHRDLDAALAADDVARVEIMLAHGGLKPEQPLHLHLNPLMLAMEAGAPRCTAFLATKFKTQRASKDTLGRTAALARFHGLFFFAAPPAAAPALKILARLGREC